MRRIIRPIFLWFALPLAAAGQNSAMSGPVSGFVYDAPSRGIRPVVGVAGTAYLGAAVASGLEGAFIAPNGKHAVALREGRMVLLRGLESTAEESDLGAAHYWEIAAWSPDSSAFAVYSAVTRSVRLLRNLPGEPAWEAPIDVSTLGGVLSSLAVGQSGRFLVAGIRGEAAGGLYWMASGTQPVLLTTMVHPLGLGFDADGRHFYAADRATNSVVRLPDLASSSPSGITTASVAEPVGLGISRQGRFLYVAGQGGKSVSVFEAATLRQISETALPALASGVRPLRDNLVYLLSAPLASGEPYLVLEGHPGAAYFVPAAEEDHP